MIALARRIALPWALTAAALFALWLLINDTAEEANNFVGIAAAALGATGSELVRRQRIAEVRPSAAWLLRAWRPVAAVPADLWKLTAEVARSARRRPGAGRGRLRTMRFAAGDGGPRDNARHAAAEAAGSFSPNTFVVGVDADRGEILVHQLVPDEGHPEQSIDPLGLR